jgi:hypothetical protein
LSCFIVLLHRNAARRSNAWEARLGGARLAPAPPTHGSIAYFRL